MNQNENILKLMVPTKSEDCCNAKRGMQEGAEKPMEEIVKKLPDKKTTTHQLGSLWWCCRICGVGPLEDLRTLGRCSFVIFLSVGFLTISSIVVRTISFNIFAFWFNLLFMLYYNGNSGYHYIWKKIPSKEAWFFFFTMSAFFTNMHWTFFFTKSRICL